jgi:hypothetical protein
MFDEFNGLPLHALVVHGAVVLVPLSALLGILFVIPLTHRWARIAFPLVAVANVPLIWVTRQSGEALREHAINGGFSDAILSRIETHMDRADVLWYFVLIYAVIAVVAYFAARSSRTSKALYQLACVLVVIGAVGVTYQVILVGDSGSRAVWNPTGDVDFTS